MAVDLYVAQVVSDIGVASDKYYSPTILVSVEVVGQASSEIQTGRSTHVETAFYILH